MGLPEPTLTFTVPSVHDDTKLDCRLYLPRTAHQSEKKRGAVVAHPYAPLGGCSDDHVVAAVSVEFLRQGYTTCTFNFRYVEEEHQFTECIEIDPKQRCTRFSGSHQLDRQA